MRYVIRHETSEGIWCSEEQGNGEGIFETSRSSTINQAVIGGHIIGRARWAIDWETKEFLYGLNRAGNVMTHVPKDSVR